MGRVARGLLLLVCAVTTLAVHAEPKRQAPAGLSASEWADVQAQISADGYTVGRGKAAGDLVAANTAQRFKAKFGTTGLAVEGDQWTLSLRTRALGRAAGPTTELPAVAPEADGDTVRYTYAAAGIHEWFINRSSGLEHGYTLTRRPAGDGELRLDVEVRGLVARPAAGGLEFVRGSEAELRYDKLKVVDAAQRELPARLEIADAGGGLRIAFDDRGARYPVTVDPLLQTAKLLPTDDGYSTHDFGTAVALAENGNTLVVGDPVALGRGAAYVFTRSSGAFGNPQRLVAADGQTGDFFGVSVAISNNTVVVGAVNDFQPTGAISGTITGSAYVFVQENGVWSQQAKLVPQDAGMFDEFGLAVAVSGELALIGAPSASVSGAYSEGAGAVYAYVRSGSAWALEQKFAPPAETFGYLAFGQAIAMQGGLALIGAPAGFNGTAGAFVFERSGDGVWMQEAHLAGPDDSRAGQAVALYGARALVGAPGSDVAGIDAGLVYAYVESSGQWFSDGTLNPPDPATETNFGRAVAISGESALVGAVVGNVTALPADVGAAYAFTYLGGWTGGLRLDLGAEPGAEYGYAVAMAGDSAIVGARSLDGAAGTAVGEIFQFELSQGWDTHARVSAPHEQAAGDGIGAVALSGDTLLVGASGDATAAGDAAGSAYAFVRSGANWSLQQKLLASDGEAGDWFGQSVDVDGDTAVIGAPEAQCSSAAPCGAAYVFVRSGGQWAEQQKLVSTDNGDSFGWAVAVAGDTTLVGALFGPNAEDAPTGAAHVFVRGGTTWTSQQKLTAADGAANDFFGAAVALEGDTAIVSAYRDSITGVARAGSAYVFARSGQTWSEAQKLTAPDAGINDRFGRSVALSGETAVVGAYLDDTAAGIDAGSAYVFVRSFDSWSLQQKLEPADGGAGDLFGRMVAVSGDSALVAAYLDDTGSGEDAGSAYLFARSGGVWTEQQKLVAADAAAGDLFGSYVAMDGGTVVIDAFWADTPVGIDSGAVYVFETDAVSNPTPFTFLERTGTATNVFVTSEAKTLAGFTGTLPVSVTGGGQYSLNSGPYTTVAGTVAAGQTLRLRHISADTANTTTTSTVTVGSYSAPFRSTTSAVDRTPNAFTFGTKTGVAPGGTVESDVVTLTGFNAAIAIVPGPGISYRIGAGTYTTAGGTLQPGQTLQVRHTATTARLGYTKTYLKVGGVTGYFTTRTE